jgi:hypothetical protein
MDDTPLPVSLNTYNVFTISPPKRPGKKILKKYPIKQRETSLEYFISSGRKRDHRFVVISTLMRKRRKTKKNIESLVCRTILITLWASTRPE